ncbi:hypothetical protein AOA77_22185 [Pseudomonas paraeruginosa]|nr:hypothetical protein AN920_19825 [Pseudomonas paraeruginosa]KQB30045.1 hypothetical protein AOA77_22185 [Pseudomonas paraeruginosa]RQF88436.1 hypothetical protein IPC241_10785 [Pseudomonas aeruginosa]
MNHVQSEIEAFSIDSTTQSVVARRSARHLAQPARLSLATQPGSMAFATATPSSVTMSSSG